MAFLDCLEKRFGQNIKRNVLWKMLLILDKNNFAGRDLM